MIIMVNEQKQKEVEDSIVVFWSFCRSAAPTNKDVKQKFERR